MIEGKIVETNNDIMMEPCTTAKVIKASAGTGKTYRLSLEFIRLLLKYGDYISYDEILMITFTKKATAEIRERIFQQLEELTNSEKSSSQIEDSLKELDPHIDLSIENLQQLRKIYQKMITEKGKLRISTIDAFVFSIFSNIIAPQYNIEFPVINNNINQDYLPELFESIFRSEHLDKFTNIFTQAHARNLKKYEDFILSLIRNRWKIELGYTQQSDLFSNANELAEENLQAYLRLMRNSLEKFSRYLKEKNIHFDPALIFKQSFNELTGEINNSDISIDNFTDIVIELLGNEIFLDQNFNKILKISNYWNGSKLLRGNKLSNLKNELLELQEKANHHLSDFILYSKLLDEQKEIIELAKIVYRTYDKIKFRDCIFTYDDISYYTYRFLYDPEISLFDSNSVLNLFYEFLSYRIRFILIDEFQDTSVIQWSILQPLISETISGDSIKPYGGTILVGDEKQSIYGWRGGERDLLLKAGTLLNRDDEPEILEKCYRYTKPLSKSINDIFGCGILHNFLENAGVKWDYNPVTTNDNSDDGYLDYKLTNLKEMELNSSEYFESIIKDDLIPNLSDGKINPASCVILTRKNKDLVTIANILDKYEINYLMENSNSIFIHPAVRPMLYLLRYLVINDIFDLLKFLRSDLILFSAKEIKEVINLVQNSRSQEEFLVKFQDKLLPIDLDNISKHIDVINLTALIKMIIEEFNINLIYSSELELRNISYFLEICSRFSDDNKEFPINVEGFLDFTEKNLDNEEFNQVGLNESEVIRLMSIHKSKGLQFETVYFLYDANPRGRKDSSQLNLIYKFDENYRGISPLLLTYNYGSVLQSGSYNYLHKENIQRQMVEELNSFYVAITRVRKNLIIRGHYNLKKGISDLFHEIKADSTNSIYKIFTNDIYDTFHNKIVEENGGFSFTEGSLSSLNIANRALNDNAPKQINGISLAQPLNIAKHVKSIQTNDFLIKQDQYLSKQNGIIIHEYLSNLTYGTKEELEKAHKKMIMRYGTLIQTNRLEKNLLHIKNFVTERHDLYDSNKWNQIFNEFTVFDNNGNEKRIDRMMVDSKEKIIKIVDYKTGKIPFNDEQLDEYKEIIGKIEFVAKENFTIITEFVKIYLEENK